MVAIEINPSNARLLADYMYHLSDRYFAAGWMAGTEYVLWAIVRGALKNGERYWLRYMLAGYSLSDDEVLRLRQLSEECGGWVMYNDDRSINTGKYLPLDDDFLVVLPFDVWQQKYTEWCRNYIGSLGQLEGHRTDRKGNGALEPVGASAEAILAAEQRLGIGMPGELRDFYALFGDVRDFYLDGTSLEWFGLENLFLVTDRRSVNPDGSDPGQPLDDPHLYLVFASYMIDSYQFAIRCFPSEAGRIWGEVIQLDRGAVFSGAYSFDDFLKFCLDEIEPSAFYA